VVHPDGGDGGDGGAGDGLGGLGGLGGEGAGGEGPPHLAGSGPWTTEPFTTKFVTENREPPRLPPPGH